MEKTRKESINEYLKTMLKQAEIMGRTSTQITLSLQDVELLVLEYLHSVLEKAKEKGKVSIQKTLELKEISLLIDILEGR